MKSSIAFYLEDVETPVGRVINLIFAGLVLLSSAIFVSQTYTLTSAVRLQLSRKRHFTNSLVMNYYRYISVIQVDGRMSIQAFDRSDSHISFERQWV